MDGRRLEYYRVCKVLYLCCEFADNLGAMEDLWPPKRHDPFFSHVRGMYNFILEELGEQPVDYSHAYGTSHERLMCHRVQANHDDDSASESQN